VTLLGELRINTPEALAFAREKFRSALVIAGLRPVAAAQLTVSASDTIRAAIPVVVTIRLEDDGGIVTLEPAHLFGRTARIRLSRKATPVDVETMQAVLAHLTREELLGDLERQVARRTAELEQERELSERLLRNMLPEPIARRMKNGETVADNHDATVLFGDLKGFTALAQECSAEAIVALLDRIFCGFDALAEQHGCEKIKTIGDCYMGATGLPIAQLDHVDRAVMMGLDMVAEIERIRVELGVPLAVRIGIHTGPVVAGVIGTRKYAYDIWGDTVNVASRLESHGVPGRVQVSDDVRVRLGRGFLVEERGVISIKGRGELRTWFVNGMAPL